MSRVRTCGKRGETRPRIVKGPISDRAKAVGSPRRRALRRRMKALGKQIQDQEQDWGPATVRQHKPKRGGILGRARQVLERVRRPEALARRQHR